MWEEKMATKTELPWLTLVCVVTAALLGGCASIEYSVREKLGQHKRELLVDRVETAKRSQERAKVEFVSALEQFKRLTGFEGGDLEAKYDEVKKRYDACASRADDVSDRIEAVRDVANALFREWQDELKEYSSDALRRDSQRRLDETKRSFVQLLEVMRAAEKRMKPVLRTLNDQVLYLKHNLNARAIATLGGVSAELQREIDWLVADMEKAIDDATRFIDEMKSDATSG
ncbi:DUF2959 domain-containing protein [Opitutales bacterium ASA1]|nr:DUF2959 domain-containing protein [Opitutales bacterium ASA1]